MLYNKLKEYSAGDVYPMHMPGHKRNTELLPPGLPYSIDITEIDGFDDMHDPQGVLLETANLAEKLYGSEKAYPLVGGSTVGIIAAIGAHTKRGDKILISKNSHRSVYNAASLFELHPIIISPETDRASGVLCSIAPGTIESALKEHPEIRLVVITSPTYEGVISDIGSIAEIVHSKGLPLLVDGAHGAHLGFTPKFHSSPVTDGADIVVMSLHKTLPALTQCSLLHVCGKYANPDETKRLLSILQTSSPSYVLMASIDQCLHLLESGKDRLFSNYELNLKRFGERIKPLRNLSVLCHGSDNPHPGFYAFDPGKIVIVTKKTPLNGFALSSTLRKEYKIELELACNSYCVAMTSICDSEKGFIRLADALLEIDSECTQ